MTGALPAQAAYAGGVAAFDDVIAQVRDEQWTLATPCREWDVRALVNHVVGEDRWVPPLVAGRTIAEVGDMLDGDLLGDAPVSAWQAARDDAAASVRGVADDHPVTLSSGVTPLAEYLRQLAADHLIHAWDLGSAIGIDLRFEEELAESVEAWFADWEDAYRQVGAIGPRPPVGQNAGLQERLLAKFGRQPAFDTATVVERFNAAFNRHDLDAILAYAAPDCVFESTAPPDGRRYEGRAAVRAAWEQVFAETPDATFTAESTFVCGDRAVVQWRYDWQGGQPGHVRGVDLFTVRDGLVAEKLSYVKG